MSIYLITYYLKEHNHDDNCRCEGENHHHHRDTYNLHGEIKELGPWAHVMPSSFLVKTEKSSEEILEKVKFTLEPNDMIIITKVAKDDIASINPALVEWIKK